jgi:hypothetical protein
VGDETKGKENGQTENPPVVPKTPEENGQADISFLSTLESGRVEVPYLTMSQRGRNRACLARASKELAPPPPRRRRQWRWKSGSEERRLGRPE